MSNRPRVFFALSLVAQAFSVAALVWWLLVAGFGAGVGGAGLVGLAAVLAFTTGVGPGVACIELGRSRSAILWASPLAALVGAYVGLLAFHFLLQLLLAAMPAASPGASARAEAAGSVVVWAVLSASMLLATLASHASLFLRTITALASVGLLVGLGMWVRALGI